MPLPPADPVTADPNSPLGRFLAHPGPATDELLRRGAHLFAARGFVILAVMAASGLVGCLLIGVSRRREHQRMVSHARSVRVLAPPDVDPHGAVTLWTNLVALLRPAWRRLLGSQPHIGFELRASSWRPADLPLDALGGAPGDGRACGRSGMAGGAHRNHRSHGTADRLSGP